MSKDTQQKRKDGKTVTVDLDLCIGASPCVAVAPGTFELTDDSKVKLLDVNAEDLDTIIAAAQSCPVSAIIVTDEEGNTLN